MERNETYMHNKYGKVLIVGTVTKIPEAKPQWSKVLKWATLDDGAECTVYPILWNKNQYIMHNSDGLAMFNFVLFHKVEDKKHWYAQPTKIFERNAKKVK